MTTLIKSSLVKLSYIFCLFFIVSKVVQAEPKYQGVNTCSGTYPSYWQDPAAKFKGMWTGQKITNAPTNTWKQDVFQLSDNYPSKLIDDKANQPWRDKPIAPH